MRDEIVEVFTLQARRAGWHLACLERGGEFCGFILRAPDGSVGLYHMGSANGREALHSGDNVPDVRTVSEGWKVKCCIGANFSATWVVEAPGGQRLVFDNDTRRLSPKVLQAPRRS
jgi:hypothetical protein